MSHSILASFDPFATHPFTNNSGLAPSPPQPSDYPHPIPSPPHFANAIRAMSTSHPSTAPNAQTYVPVQAPQPQRQTPASPGKAPAAIFVPFRQETSSPDLGDILVKKSKKTRTESMSTIPRTFDTPYDRRLLL